MNALLNTHGWHIAGWTMLHFLWIGTAIALLGMLMHYFAGRQRQGLRYLTALVTLVVFAVAPVGIAWHLSNHLSPKSEVTKVEPQTSAPLPPAAVLPLAIEDKQPDEPLVIDLAEMPIDASSIEVSPSNGDGNIASLPTEQPNAEAVGYRRASARHTTDSVDGTPRSSAVPYELSRIAAHLPWLWLVGAPLTFLLLTTGLVGSERLRRTAQSASDEIKKIADRLAGTLAISRNVAVAVSDRITQPILIGIIRPMILLPSSALTGWTPEELEMVLLHELSHVRRWDNLVNLAQRLIESLLFFHPCVWWISRQVRIDREECVDAAVVGRTAKPQAYAELLVNFAAARNQLPRNLAASAMARHPLAGRIRRILNMEDEPMLVKRSTATLAGFAMLVVLSLLVWQPAPESIAQETKQEEVVEVKDSTTEGTEITEEVTEADFNKPKQEHKTVLVETYMISPQDMVGVKEWERFRESADTAKMMWEKNALVVVATRDVHAELRVLLEKRRARTANSPFPTLEEQRAADLVYKLLNVEVEKLSDEELKRVKAKKFAGGLKVTDGQFPGGMGRGMHPFQSGDLLVGLHVWPTTSLADIETIFQRDDLDELSPLKFYVIRQEMRPTKKEMKRQEEQARKSRGGGEFGGGGYGGEYGGGYGGGEFGGGEYGGGYGGELGASREPELEAVDLLITGRIEPDLEAWRTIQQRRKAKTIENSQKSVNGASLQQTTQLQNQIAQLQKQRNDLQQQHNALAASLAAADNEGSHQKALTRAVALQAEMVKVDAQIKKIRSDHAKLQIDLQKRQEQLRNAKTAVDARDSQQMIDRLRSMLAAKEQELKALEVAQKEAAKNIRKSDEAAQRTNELRKRRDEAIRLSEIKRERSRKRPQYLYAGKPFEHWRDLFKYELSTERRIEAIKALAAFGRTGKGKEAAEAILDVAGEYDFHRSSKAKVTLRDEIIQSLLGNVSTEYWLPLLQKEFDARPLKWDWLVLELTPEVREMQQKLVAAKLLKKLCLSESSELAIEAQRHFFNNYKELDEADTDSVIQQAVRLFEENHNLDAALRLLYLKEMAPKFIEWSLSDTPQVRFAVRELFYRHQGTAVLPEVTRQMIEILNDPEKEDQHLAAIRTLAAMGESAKSSRENLVEIMRSSDKPKLVVAALYALGAKGSTPDSLESFVESNQGFDLTAAEISNRLEAEQEAVFGHSRY